MADGSDSKRREALRQLRGQAAGAAGGGARIGALNGDDGQGRLRRLLTQRQRAGGAPRATLAGGDGSGRAVLRELLARRLGGQGGVSGPQAETGRLRERIGRLRARLDELEGTAGGADVTPGTEGRGPAE